MRPGRARANELVAGVSACIVATLVWSGVEMRAEAPQDTRRPAPTLAYDVVKTYAHDPKAFTQGLIYRNGFLYESTGLKGQSSLRKVRLDTGEVIDFRAVDKRYFAEGLTDWGGKLIQLTWETNIGFVYDVTSFAPVSTFTYTGEGWGLTHDDKRLIMSDGTSALRFLEPETQREIGRVTVRDAGKAIDRLNELEFVKGEVFANVWLTDRIAIISPASGQVTAWLDLSQLHAQVRQGEDVLNGIAYDAAANRLFVTGKLWSRLYEIRVRR
jgi:glutaminyl-peptide cyclotransferase